MNKKIEIRVSTLITLVVLSICAIYSVWFK